MLKDYNSIKSTYNHLLCNILKDFQYKEEYEKCLVMCSNSLNNIASIESREECAKEMIIILKMITYLKSKTPLPSYNNTCVTINVLLLAGSHECAGYCREKINLICKKFIEILIYNINFPMSSEEFGKFRKLVIPALPVLKKLYQCKMIDSSEINSFRHALSQNLRVFI